MRSEEHVPRSQVGIILPWLASLIPFRPRNLISKKTDTPEQGLSADLTIGKYVGVNIDVSVPTDHRFQYLIKYRGLSRIDPLGQWPLYIGSKDRTFDRPGSRISTGCNVAHRFRKGVPLRRQ